MTDRVRLLIVGCGWMAPNHVAAFAGDPRVEIIGCVDSDPARADQFATRYGLARSFGSVEEAIAWGHFDAASNVTPDIAHHPTTMKLIGAGKHIFCEKPLAQNVALAEEMTRAVEAAGLVNMVNLIYRNVPALERARGMIADGMIGEVRHVEASYRQSWLVGRHWGEWRSDPNWLWRLSHGHGSRGVLGDVGIHILDFATHAIGMLPVAQHARLQTFRKAPNDVIGDYRLDANDSAILSLEFENGALGVVHASRFMTGYANTIKLEISGTEGAIAIERGDEWVTLLACLGDDVHTQAWRRLNVRPVETLYAKFIGSVLSGTGQAPSFRHATELQKVIDRCFA